MSDDALQARVQELEEHLACAVNGCTNLAAMLDRFVDDMRLALASGRADHRERALKAIAAYDAYRPIMQVGLNAMVNDGGDDTT